MIDYTVDEAEFTDPINITETTDPGHADYINAAPKALFGNTKYNKAQIEALQTEIKNYALVTEAGYALALSIDTTTYIMSLSLKNKAGTVLSTETIDFPLESMVVSAAYADGEITLTLQNGETTSFSVADLVNGLVSESRKIAGIDLADDITVTELLSALGVESGANKTTVDNALSSSSSNPVANSVITEALAKKSDTDHTHSLSNSTITGTLPISKGGTGGTTAAAARTNLELSTALTDVSYSFSDLKLSFAKANGNGYNVLLGTDKVIEDSSYFVTSGAVYSAIEAANKRTHIVIAAYNTQNPLKANADYTCTSSNATEIFTQALSEIAAGGKIELLDGTYNMQWVEDSSGEADASVEINLANVTVEGSGWATIINQCQNGDETMPVFKISAGNVTLKNFMITSVSIGSPDPHIYQAAEGATYENIFFIDNEDWASYFPNTVLEEGYGCIIGSGDCSFTRILNCRVYRSSSTSAIYMFNFGDCTTFSGVIGGNISSGYDNISVLFKNETHKSNTVLYGHIAADTAVK